MASSRWIVCLALWLPAFIACASHQEGATFPDDSATGQSDDSGSSGPQSVGDGSGPILNLPDSSPGTSANAACKGGHYQGTFSGSYSSHLILGIPLMVTGNVDMTLNQAGNPMMTCTFAGETEKCSDFFQVSGGTVTGVANSTMVGDAMVGGYPYFCELTGTLDCKNLKLVGGWIQCTYCVGMLADGGMACSPLIAGVGGGIGGQFSGPVTANYNTSNFSFVNGTWNGAEALGNVDGGAAIVDGAPASSYIAADGGYGIGNYGGSGTWNATHQ
jgi:hypothetical protein